MTEPITPSQNDLNAYMPVPPLDACLRDYPFPALRLDAGDNIIGTNPAAVQFVDEQNLPWHALLPSPFHRCADEIRHKVGESRTGPPQTYKAGRTLQWTLTCPDPISGQLLAYAADMTALVSSHPQDVAGRCSSVSADAWLLTKERLLHRFIEHVPVAAAMFDRDMRYLLTSKRWRADFDFLPKDIEGLCHYDLVDVPEAWRQRHRCALMGEDTLPVEVSLTRPDNGREEWLSTQALPWTRDDGEIGGILIFAEVITQRKAAEAEEQQRLTVLRQQQKMESLGTLAGGIAHEINSPAQYINDNLTFIATAMQDYNEIIALYRDILTAADLPADQRSRLDAAETNLTLDYLRTETETAINQAMSGIAAISRIIKAIRTFSHPGYAERTPVDINRVLRDATVVSCNQWKLVATITEDLDPSMPIIMGHGDQLGQVILNLIINAVHAIEDACKAGHGHIHLKTRAMPEHVEIEIEDNGIGISPQNHQKIFDPFFTTKAPGRGSGQGLSIAHGIVTRGHGGNIFCESDPGHFTRFTLILPYRTKDLCENDESRQ